MSEREDLIDEMEDKFGILRNKSPTNTKASNNKYIDVLDIMKSIQGGIEVSQKYIYVISFCNYFLI